MTIGANLNAALGTSLDQVPDGVPKDQGIRYGERAAERLIELRADDGRFAPIVFDRPPAPGVWRPTPPAMVPFFDPWLGQVDPFVLDSPSQFDPGPPPPINSDLYVEEFEEVRDYGVSVGSLRSAQQTQTALFFSDVGVGPLQAGLRDLASRRAAGHQRLCSPVRGGRCGHGRQRDRRLGRASSATAGGARSPRSARPIPTAIPGPSASQAGRRSSSPRPIRTGRAA